MDKNKLIKLAKLVMKFSEVTTDKGTLIIDGDLAVGNEVSVEVEGEYKPAEDGEYLTEIEKITIKDGKVESIEAIEVEEEEVTEEPKEEPKEEIILSKLEVKQQEFSQSYEETERKLAEAIGWCWVIEAGDGWCIVGKYNEDDWSERYYRYSYTLDENEDVVLGDFVEVFRRFVSEEEIAKLENDTTEEIVNLQSQVKELEEKLNQPVEQGIKMSATVKEKTIESGALKYFKN